MPILGFLKRCFPCPERLACYRKGQRSFLTIYFHDLLHKNAGGYMGLQGATRDYRRLQGVTGGYKRLLEVTRGYRGLQRTI